MSYDAVSWAFKVQGLSPAQKLTLVALANYADADNRSWPSQKTISRITCLSVRSVNRAMADLEEKNLLTRERRNRSDGYRTSDIVTLNLGATVAVDDMPHSPILGATVAYQESSVESRNLKTLSAKPDGFADFWDSYPKKIGKGAARKAYASAVKKAPPDEIILALRRQKFSEDPKFIPHPATWLNAERWLDDMTEPEKPKFDFEAHERWIKQVEEEFRDA